MSRGGGTTRDRRSSNPRPAAHAPPGVYLHLRSREPEQGAPREQEPGRAPAPRAREPVLLEQEPERVPELREQERGPGQAPQERAPERVRGLPERAPEQERAPRGQAPEPAQVPAQERGRAPVR